MLSERPQKQKLLYNMHPFKNSILWNVHNCKADNTPVVAWGWSWAREKEATGNDCLGAHTHPLG